MLCSQLETATGCSHIQTQSLFVWKTARACWENMPTKCPFPKQRELAFCRKSGKAAAPEACRTARACVSSGIWCFEQQGGNWGLRVPSWSHPPLFCTSRPVYTLSYHFLQKMGLVKGRLEASSHFLWACPAFTSPARVRGPEPSFSSENSKPHLRGQWLSSFPLKWKYISNLRLLRYGMKGSGGWVSQ